MLDWRIIDSAKQELKLIKAPKLKAIFFALFENLNLFTTLLIPLNNDVTFEIGLCFLTRWVIEEVAGNAMFHDLALV